MSVSYLHGDRASVLDDAAHLGADALMQLQVVDRLVGEPRARPGLYPMRAVGRALRLRPCEILDIMAGCNTLVPCQRAAAATRDRIEVVHHCRARGKSDSQSDYGIH